MQAFIEGTRTLGQNRGAADVIHAMDIDRLRGVKVHRFVERVLPVREVSCILGMRWFEMWFQVSALGMGATPMNQFTTNSVLYADSRWIIPYSCLCIFRAVFLSHLVLTSARRFQVSNTLT